MRAGILAKFLIVRSEHFKTCLKRLMNKLLVFVFLLYLNSCLSQNSVVANGDINTRYLSEAENEGSKQLIQNLLLPEN